MHFAHINALLNLVVNLLDSDVLETIACASGAFISVNGCFLV